MKPSTLRRSARRLALGATAIAAIVFGGRAGLALYIQTFDSSIRFGDAYAFAGTALGAWVRCELFECEIEMPGGLEAELWADESLLPGPAVALDVDERGRVFVAEGERFFGGAEDNRNREFWLEDDLAARTVADRDAYIEKWIRAGAVEASRFTDRADRLTWLEDTDGDGAADSRTVLAEFRDRLDGILAGVLVREGTAWVANVPSLYRFRDSDGDGVPDAREILSTGYGVKTSLQGHDLHGLVFGPDGRIYFSVGDRGYHVVLPDGRVLEPPMGPGRGAVFRMQPDGRDLEVFATGLRNPQELAFDDFGNLFTGDNNSDGGDEARIVYVVEGGDSGWAMPYQSLAGDDSRGPWNAEKLWHLYHAGQPAWIVPPIAHLTRGPAGLAHSPGAGLPERYRDRFFLADYRYQRGLSLVWSFGVAPEGAGFRLVDEHPFVSNVLATDVAFGWDGNLYVSMFSARDGGQQILRVRHPEAAADPVVAEVGRLVREGFAVRSTAELAALLGHADPRVRLRAQYELAERGDPAPLAVVLRDERAALLARIHAVWGLGQQGAAAFRAGVGDDLAWASGADPELGAQLLRVAGEAGAEWLADPLAAALADPRPRHRFFAAQSLGRLRVRAAVAPLYDVLERNADKDPFLRHAAVHALHRIGDLESALLRAGDASRAVRLAVLLQLRRAERPEIARFLADPDPFLVVEAARAIYDVPIEEAFPALAELADGDSLPLDDDAQTSLALHRRVIGANRSLGTEEAALRLAHYATRRELPASMRRLALEVLGEYVAPRPRDLAMSWHRPLEPRETSVVFAALDRYGPALIESDLGARALEIASAYGRVPLRDEDLLELVEDAGSGSGRRVAALSALDARRAGDPLERALRAALASEDPLLRARARDVLAGRRPDEALAALAAIPASAPLAERQAAWRTLASIDREDARRRVLDAFDRLGAGDLDPAVAVEVVEAARAIGGDAARARLEQLEAERRTDPMSARRYALAGGDAERGRQVFESRGDCQRCHGAEPHGARAGPDLSGVARRRDPDYLLESVLDPQAEIADGFATLTVVLEDGRVVSGNLVRESPLELVVEVGGREQSIPVREIRTRSPATSGMPPLGLALSPRELRDLLAYVATL